MLEVENNIVGKYNTYIYFNDHRVEKRLRYKKRLIKTVKRNHLKENKIFHFKNILEDNYQVPLRKW